MGRSQRGETIVGISEDYKDAMPNPPQRGPSKTPMKAKMEAVENENRSLKDTVAKQTENISDMKTMMLQMQQALTSMQQQQETRSIMGAEKPKK